MVKWVLHVVPNIRPGLCLANAQGKSIILNAWFQLWNMEVELWWFGQRISWYSDGPIISLNGQITASDYVDTVENQVHPTVQILFPNNDAIFQDDISSISQRLKCSVLVWWAWRCTSTSSLANTITRLKHHQTTVVIFREYGEKQFPPPSSLKQLEDVLHEQRYNIPLETCQNFYNSIQKGYKLYYKQMLAQLHINKEIWIFHNWFLILSIPCLMLW